MMACLPSIIFDRLICIRRVGATPHPICKETPRSLRPSPSSPTLSTQRSNRPFWKKVESKWQRQRLPLYTPPAPSAPDSSLPRQPRRTPPHPHPPPPSFLPLPRLLRRRHRQVHRRRHPSAKSATHLLPTPPMQQTRCPAHLPSHRRLLLPLPLLIRHRRRQVRRRRRPSPESARTLLLPHPRLRCSSPAAHHLPSPRRPPRTLLRTTHPRRQRRHLLLPPGRRAPRPSPSSMRCSPRTSMPSAIGLSSHMSPLFHYLRTCCYHHPDWKPSAWQEIFVN
ncbi:hypothetical protein VPH35_115433 [Triticum aestivum]